MNDKRQPYAPGVTKAEEVWFDEYVGSGEAIIAAGLVELHQLPGQPTSGKYAASFFPDGTRGPKGNNSVSRMVGYKQVVRLRKDAFAVRVMIAKDERERRRSKWKLEFEREQLQRQRVHQLQERATPRRAHLTLVWSAPA